MAVWQISYKYKGQLTKYKRKPDHIKFDILSYKDRLLTSIYNNNEL